MATYLGSGSRLRQFEFLPGDMAGSWGSQCDQVDATYGHSNRGGPSRPAPVVKGSSVAILFREDMKGFQQGPHHDKNH